MSAGLAPVRLRGQVCTGTIAPIRRTTGTVGILGTRHHIRRLCMKMLPNKPRRSNHRTTPYKLQTSVNTSDNNLVTIATGNTFQQVAGANGGTERQALIIKNNNTNGDTCWVFFGSNKASKEKSVIIASGDSYVRYWPFVSSDAMQAACASTSDTLVVEIKQARLQPTP